ncbi:MAG: hypothetical protein QOG15_730 [Solirubrobacteraceae bacterium]|jgi:FkbM family methyltransferase|nr:hypothetical protein [Solirubrobacteraceae bacterium]
MDRVVAGAYRRDIKGTGRVARVLYAKKVGRSVPCGLDGLEWEADPLDWMDQQILKTGSYEPEIAEHLVERMRSGDVFWDIGANAGVHTLRVKAARPDIAVIAFEPSPSQYTRLRHNATINDLDIAAYCVALAAQRGYQRLSVVDIGNSGLNSLKPRDGVSYSGSFRCWCDTGDDLVSAGAESPSVMKIDVEGAEDEVFAGMPRTLASRRLRHIVFESNDGAAPALVDAGFTITRIHDSGGGGINWSADRVSA